MPRGVFWGPLTSASVAAIIADHRWGSADALTGLQNPTIVAADAVRQVVMVLLCVALYKDHRTDRVVVVDHGAVPNSSSAAITGQCARTGDNFDLVTPLPQARHRPARR